MCAATVLGRLHLSASVSDNDDVLVWCAIHDELELGQFTWRAPALHDSGRSPPSFVQTLFTLTYFPRQQCITSPSEFCKSAQQSCLAGYTPRVLWFCACQIWTWEDGPVHLSHGSQALSRWLKLEVSFHSNTATVTVFCTSLTQFPGTLFH